jgi:nucleotidyltransferase substrate binding protein (TIGR01987 family)
MSLDLTPLENAIARLSEGLVLHNNNPDTTIIRDGLIQRFEFTYELSHKMLKRALEATAASPERYDHMPFADLIRTGSEQGLLATGWPAWRQFRDMRAKTSHSYDEKIALTVLQGIPAFLAEAEFLCTQLKARQP